MPNDSLAFHLFGFHKFSLQKRHIKARLEKGTTSFPIIGLPDRVFTRRESNLARTHWKGNRVRRMEESGASHVFIPRESVFIRG